MSGRFRLSCRPAPAGWGNNRGRSGGMAIADPYLLFLGDAADQLAAKTAQGIADWRPRRCVGQLRFGGCAADVGFADMSLDEGVAGGAKTLVIGVANRGGVISEDWIEVLERALDLGMDLAAGLHNKLADIPRLAAAAERIGRRLFDVRHPNMKFSLADGGKRPGKPHRRPINMWETRPHTGCDTNPTST